MTKAILCFCCPGTGQQKRQSSNYSPVATYGSQKNAAGAKAAAAWVKKRLIFVGIIFIYFQVGLNSNERFPPLKFILKQLLLSREMVFKISIKSPFLMVCF